MRIISARQAWHDSLHHNRDSVLAVAAQKAELGRKHGKGEGKVVVMLEDHNGQHVAKTYKSRQKGDNVHETRPGRRLSTDQCAHMLAAGLIMQAIDTLPKPVQHFGHYLYSPTATFNDLSIAHGMVWLSSGLDKLTEKQRSRAYWMALAAIQSHKRIVSSGEEMAPGEVCVMIEERTGHRINPSNWARDYAAVWAHLAKKVDDLDRAALKPVAMVVESLIEEDELSANDFDRWVRQPSAKVA